MKPGGGAKIPWSAYILATTTGFITRWTSKNQILIYIYTLFLDDFCVLIVKIRC